jgi:lathosterol oxidase
MGGGCAATTAQPAIMAADPPSQLWRALSGVNAAIIGGVLVVALVHDASRSRYAADGSRRKKDGDGTPPVPDTILSRARNFSWTSYGRDLPYQKWNLLYLCIAAVCWRWASPGVEHTVEVRAGWIACVVLRNLAILWAWYEPLHRWLYVNPRRHQMVKEGKKFNPSFPDQSQHNRDRFFSTLGALQISGYEVLWLHLCATGRLATVSSHAAAPLWCAMWYVISPFWVKTHFYFVHRFLHVKFVYRWVHYLHHRSVNPGPWSGMSMHPIEQAIYCSAVLFPWGICAQHPVHFYFCMYNVMLSPAPGHSGFQEPGGSKMHYLHHSKFDCNFGSSIFPLDALFGTFRAE